MKKMQLTLLMAGLLFSSLNSRAQTNGFITNGLIAYHPFNGNALDQSGNGNNGTVFGATLTNNHFDVPAMAYYFNGTSGDTSGDYISANVPNLPTGSAARTVCLWAKSHPIANQGATLLYWGTNQNGQALQVLNNSAPYTWQGGGWGGGNDINTGVLVDTNWHYVVQSYNTNGMTMWLDGTNYGTANISISTPLSTLLIGTGIELDYYNGAISDVRIYNRALSTQEVTALYAAESSVTSGIILLPTITFNGTVGMSYSIEYTTNLSSPNWTILTNIVLQTTNYLFPDTSSVSQPYRFYQVVPQ